jgi:hypothetical protein
VGVLECWFGGRRLDGLLGDDVIFVHVFGFEDCIRSTHTKIEEFRATERASMQYTVYPRQS